jgi:hypothetical protein
VVPIGKKDNAVAQKKYTFNPATLVDKWNTSIIFHEEKIFVYQLVKVRSFSSCATRYKSRFTFLKKTTGIKTAKRTSLAKRNFF